LIEAGPKILAAFDEKLSTRARLDLTHLGVMVKTDTKVTLINADEVQTESEKIACKTAIWAAGVAPSILGKRFKGSKTVELDKAGRIIVSPDLSTPSYQNIFVIGDQSAFMGKDGKPLPGLAPVAMQQGTHAAINISKRITNEKTLPFHYLDKGSLATIGRKKAVLQFGKIRMTGFLAWCAWLFIHIFYLIGFKNRFFVLFEWTWNYLTYSKGARLIVDKDWHLKS
jgi:NADH dehydrogenase